MKKCKLILIAVAVLVANLLGMEGYPIIAAETDVATIEVPAEAFDMNGTTVDGITKEWFRTNCPDNDSTNPAYLKIVIPATAVTIGSNAFCTSKSNKDEDPGYTYIHPSNYKIVAVDFTEATALESIEKQAFMSNSELQGTIEFPDSLKTIKGSAFRHCGNLQGVYLPEGLRELGNASSGSVFHNCAALQFVRVKGSTASASVELPSGLESIGRDLFNGALTNVESAPMSIPETVGFIGVTAFQTPAITAITVKSNNVSQYDKKAFQGSGYGMGKRVTIFNNYDVYKSFASDGLQDYKNSLTFEYTLTYGNTGKTEQKLSNQPMRCVKDAAGNWHKDENYLLPEAPSVDKEGYTGGWICNGHLLTPDSVVQAGANSVELSVGEVLAAPTIQFEVDGELRNQEGSSLDMNVSNDKEHQVGVKVSHPLEGKSDAEGYVEFAYKWTDIWSGGLSQYEQGPRMQEEGFGNLLTGKPTIPINGATHERTENGGYSDVDYGRGYYLVEVYGYFVKDGRMDLFYKSASSGFGSDSHRTTDTKYTFYVLTSGGAVEPEVAIKPIEEVYGYKDATLEAQIKPVDGEVHTFQWHRAERQGQIKEGVPIEGATALTYHVEEKLGAGIFHYYLEVTSTKTQNGDVAKTAVPTTFTVHQAGNTWTQEPEIRGWVYGEKHDVPVAAAEFGEVRFLYGKQGAGEYTSKMPESAGLYNMKALVEDTKDYKGLEIIKQFTIEKAVPNIVLPVGLIITEGEKLGSLKLPKGFSWLDKEQKVGTVGDKYFKAIYTPEDIENYKVVSDISIAVRVNEAKESLLPGGKESAIPGGKESAIPGTGDNTDGRFWMSLLAIMSAILVRHHTLRRRG